MEDLDDLMHYAVSLEFNAPQEPNQLAVIGIAFANAAFCKRAYFLLKDKIKGQKINAEISINAITLDLEIVFPSGERLFKANLNYDPIFLDEFIRLWPPGQSIALIFGAKRNCDFYVINPEEVQKDFQPFDLGNYEVIR